PLHLIPQHLRVDCYTEYAIRIQGDMAVLNVMRLEREYGGRVEDVKVERILFSGDKGTGSGTFRPSDPK
ncbi:protein prkA, partial [Bacillus paralicheniformis]|nr:protein prkA [Bacillus paralicheniformis]